MASFIILIVLINLFGLARTDNYLIFFPPETGSQTVALASAATAMIERNHSVTLIVAEDFTENVKKRMHNDKYTMETFKSSVTVDYFRGMVKNLTGHALKGNYFGMMKTMSNSAPMVIYQQCEDFFSDQQLIKRLEKQKFDLFLVHTLLACPVLLAQHLNVQFVSLITAIPPSMIIRQFGSPVNPAYSPELPTGFSNRMTFLQRVQNTLFSGVLWMMADLPFKSFDDMKQRYNIKPEISTFESASQAELLFICSHFTLDFPRAYQPNVISIGGLSAMTPRPLPQVSGHEITVV